MSEKLKILIAYDGSASADAALNDLQVAGLPREAEVLIVNVLERWLPPPSSYEFVEEVFGNSDSAAAKTVRVIEDLEIQRIEDESPILAKAIKTLRSYFPDWKIETFSVHGSPSYQIVSKAKEWNADIIVVGSHGTTGNKLFALGSVSQKIANEAECSVRVVRGNTWKKGAPTRVLIGLDGTRAARLAVLEVAGRMWMTGSEVRIVTAKDSSENERHSGEATSKTNAWINGFIGEAQQVLKQSRLGFSNIIEEGDPKQIIVRAADEWGADSIFIGSNDTGSFYENLLLGSVATAVVARAHCTVEIVRHKNRAVNNV